MEKKLLNIEIAPNFWTISKDRDEDQFNTGADIMSVIYEKTMTKQDLDILGERIKSIVLCQVDFNEEELSFVNSKIRKIKHNNGESADALIELSDFISEHFQGTDRKQRLVRLHKGILETFDRIMYIYAVAYMSLKLLDQNLNDIPTPTMINEKGEIVPISLFAKD